jgi:hypothetical protein
MSGIFFRELGMPAPDRHLTDAISDLLFVKGGRPRRRADRRHPAADPRTGTFLEVPQNRGRHQNRDVPENSR